MATRRHSTPAPTADVSAPAPRAPRRGRATGEEKKVRDFAIGAARLMADLHCTDVVVLDVRGMSDVTDYVVIGTGTSDRQIRSVAGGVVDLAKESGLSRLGFEADGPTTWVVVDLVDVVVHLFEPVTRSHYDLEMLWGDAPRVKWQRRATAKADEAGEPAE